jgi:hypothetical protein
MRTAMIACALLLLASVSACKTTSSANRATPELLGLVGVWEDGGGCAYTIEKVGRTLEVSLIQDRDNEIFQVTAASVVDGAFEFTYLVPSTGYVVTHRIREVGASEFVAEWENQHDSGTDTFYRVK